LIYNDFQEKNAEAYDKLGPGLEIDEKKKVMSQKPRGKCYTKGHPKHQALSSTGSENRIEWRAFKKT